MKKMGLQRMWIYNDTEWKIKTHIILQQYPL